MTYLLVLLLLTSDSGGSAVYPSINAKPYIERQIPSEKLCNDLLKFYQSQQFDNVPQDRRGRTSLVVKGECLPER